MSATGGELSRGGGAHMHEHDQAQAPAHAHEPSHGRARAPGHAHDAVDGPHPTVVAVRESIELAAGLSTTAIEAALRAFATDFVARLAAGGCRLIGHIKGMLAPLEGGGLYFNVTGFTGGVALKGVWRGGASGERDAAAGYAAAAELTINAIVFGIGAGEVERLARDALLTLRSALGAESE